MTKDIMAVVTKIVKELKDLSPEERRRVIGASLTLLGDEPTTLADKKNDVNGGGDHDNALPVKARAWMRQNDISMTELEQVFHFSEGGVEVIASEIPGKNQKQQTFNAYILVGIGKFLTDATSNFDDKSARALCKSSGCLNEANHSQY